MIEHTKVKPAVLVLGAAALLAGRLAGRNYRRLPLASSEPRAGNHSVSVIIPARDEAKTLPLLLESLARLSPCPAEIIVLDDGSSDGTGEVARGFGALVVRIETIPNGWTGKSNACWIGAQHARGDWLLFTDADTVHAPQSLNAALTAADEFEADMVSFLAGQQCCTFWERLLLPYAYFLYFAGVGPVNQGHGQPVANGQYILCRRSAYFHAGGHSAVRTSVIEDVELARATARAGLRVVLLRGEEYLSVRMYADLPSLWRGFSKNTFRFVRLSPVSGLITALSGLVIASCALSSRRPRHSATSAVTVLAPAVVLAPWYARFGVPRRYALAYPLAASAFQILALDSLRRTLLPGRTVWKGRRY